VDTTPPVAADPINPANPDGRNSWYLEHPTVTPSANDPVGPGVNTVSGVAETQYQVDNGPWLPAAPFQVAEGTHDIRVRSFDQAGNASDVVERTVRVDISAPTARIGTYPPSPNTHDWFRQSPQVAIQASDGRDAPGVDGATWSLDGGGPVHYLDEFPVPEGQHQLAVQSTDLAGKSSPVFSQLLNVDLTPPAPTPADPPPSILLFLGNALQSPAVLRFNVQDNLSKLVKVRVQIYNVLGDQVRSIDAPGATPDGYRPVGPGSVSWDGSYGAGRHVLPGLYFFRVQALDLAGNSAISTESREFLVGVTGLPL
jgi:hypothetical protein